MDVEKKIYRRFRGSWAPVSKRVAFFTTLKKKAYIEARVYWEILHFKKLIVKEKLKVQD